MRVTQNMPQTELLSNLDNLMTSILTSQQQLASGVSISQPSDNPVGTAQYMSITQAQAWNTQWTHNAQNASSYMSAADGAMTQLQQVLQSANTLAVQASSGTMNSADLNAQASQAGQLVEQAQSLANTQFASQYVFAGTTGAEPWNPVGSSWNLTASSPSQAVTVGTSVSIPTGVDGFALFQGPVAGAATPGILTSNGAAATPGVLEQLQTDLQSGNSAALSTDITNIQSAINHVSSMQSDLGARMQRVTAITSTLQSVAVQLQSQGAQVASTNMPAVVAQLTNQTTVYQAALALGAKALLPTLAQYLP